MAMKRRTATWLDLAAPPRWTSEHLDLKIHPLSAGCGECFVLSLSGRMVCTGEGKLTVFRSRQAVERFLLLLELDEPMQGEQVEALPSSSCGQHCLRLCGSTLCGCNLEGEDSAPVPHRAKGYRNPVAKDRLRASRVSMF